MNKINTQDFEADTLQAVFLLAAEWLNGKDIEVYQSTTQETPSGWVVTVYYYEVR